MPREQVAGPTEPREKRHDGGGVEPRDVRAAFETSAHGTVAAAPVMAEMKWQMPFDRQMDVDCPGEKRNHAKREAHEKTEEIKIRPGHSSPLAQPIQAAPNQFRSGTDTEKPLFPGSRSVLLPGRSTSARRSNNPGVRRISPRSNRGVRESAVSAMASSARCNSGSLENCSAPAKSHESIFASMARSSDCKPGV